MRTSDRRSRSVVLAVPLLVLAVVAGAAVPAGAADGEPVSLGSGGATTRLVVLSQRSGQADDVARAVRTGALSSDALDVAEEPGGRTVTLEVPADRAEAVADTLRERSDVAAVAPETTFETTDLIPSDIWYSGHQATYMAAMGMPKAWSLDRGSSDVRLAVIDTGVDVDHPDLAGKVVGTFDATTGSSNVVDGVGHGTLVASVAAASTGNGEGIAGTGWATSILAVKVAGSGGVIRNQAVADGIEWAISHDADIINLSLGGDRDDVTQAAISDAVAAGIVVVASAGNSASDQKFYPAAYAGVLAVGATNQKGTQRADFSEYGSWVDVGAPGVAIYGAEAGGPGYVPDSGTSFSAPLVAGIAGLLRSFRPELSASQISEAITATAGTSTMGFGHGLVDAAAALAYHPSFPAPDVTAPTAGSTVARDLTVQADVSDPLATQVRAGLVSGGPSVTGDVTGGHAQLVLPTYGSSGQEVLRVVTCRESVCSTTATDVPLTVVNPVPTVTSPTDGARLLDTLVLAATAAGVPAVRFLSDGDEVLGTDVEAPFALTVPVTRLAPGEHTITAVVCDQSGTTCATDAPSAPVHVTLDHLVPTLSAVAPNPFSPTGDGRRDATRISFTLDTASSATIRILDPGGSAVRTLDLGVLTQGAHSVVWDGKADGGSLVPSATYRVVLDTAATVGGDAMVGHVEASVRVDRSAPHLSAVQTTYPAVYPVKDGYRDTTALTVATNEPVAKVTVTVYDSRGKAVWSKTKEDLAAGRVGASFSGRSSSSGKALAPGSYTYAFRVVDAALNVTTTAEHPVLVSAKRLSKHSVTRTVTALASFEIWYYEDDCSGLYNSPWSAGALRWEACPGGYVLSVHHVTLPKATVYGSARVSMYGRGAGSSTALFRYVDDHDRFAGSATRFHAPTGTHQAEPIKVTTALLEGRRLRWSIDVEDGDAYAAQSFTVTYTYYTLV